MLLCLGDLEDEFWDCAIPTGCDIGFDNWIKFIWKYKKVSNKLGQRPMEKTFLLLGLYGFTGTVLFLESWMLSRPMLLI